MFSIKSICIMFFPPLPFLCFVFLKIDQVIYRNLYLLHAYQLSQIPYHIFQTFVVDAIVSWELFPFLLDKELGLITLLQSRIGGFITYNFGKAVFTSFAHKMHYSRVLSWQTKMLSWVLNFVFSSWNRQNPHYILQCIFGLFLKCSYFHNFSTW